MKHGHGCAGKRSSEYLAWAHMKERCNNPNCRSYHNYGGRGIKVCERWQDFRNFLADMGLKPSADLTSERIDNDGSYEPGNCCWTTHREQRNNQRACPNQFWFIAFNPSGECFISNNQSEFARQYGLERSNVSACLRGKLKTHKGWRFTKI